MAEVPRLTNCDAEPFRASRYDEVNKKSTKQDTRLTRNIGNTHDEDSDKEPEPPVKVVDKTPARTTKRNAPAEAPASKAPVTDGRGARRPGGNEGG
jgi:plasminogen activator inhibitor 1 RNA-binding protein